MQSSLPVIILFVSFGLVFAAGFVEMVMGAAWRPRYFTAGLPLIVFEIPVAAYHADIPSALLLETKNRSCLFGTLLFSEIAPDTYGFRYRYFELSLLRFKDMHGVLAFDQANHRVVLKSFLNLADIAFVLFGLVVLALAVIDNPGRWLSAIAGVGFVVFLLGLLTFIDVQFNSWRCRALAQFAAYAWARKYAPTPSEFGILTG